MDFKADMEQVKAFYNRVENLDADFRRTGSRIKGLRAFNNWVKFALIRKFAVSQAPALEGLNVLEIGCGKGGDLHKWHRAPTRVAIYVGLDPAAVSIVQARERWEGYRATGKYGGAVRRAEFVAQDCFGESLEDVPVIQEVGFAHGGRGGGGGGGGGVFDIASLMFCMHYAFQSEARVRMMLANITGSLKPGGRVIGCVPSSRVIGERIREFEATVGALGMGDYQPPAAWGNDIYNIRFEGKTPPDGVFGRPFGDRYIFTLAEAVDAPEFVVPWEIFCDIAKEYGLELRYCKPLNEIWDEEKNDKVLARLSMEMGVVDAQGTFLVSDQEMEAAKFYLAFCFDKA